MKIHLFFTLCLISVTGVSTNEVTAYSGGGVRITCKYEKGYEGNNKYFCKGERRPCADQIKTGVKHTWVHEGRFSLYDDTSAKVFWVLMRNLAVEDSGTYQCGVDITAQIDKYTPVELTVKRGMYGVKTITETGYIGGVINISCNYPESHMTDPKFLCKTVDTDVCIYNTSVNESGRWINEGRVSLYDDRRNQTLTVTIRDVTEQDSGEYWCGAESDFNSDHGYIIYIREIYLKVTGEYPATPVVKSSPATTVQPEHIDSTPAFPGLAVYSSVGAGLVLMTAGVITAVYCRIKRKPEEPETVTQSRVTNEEYEHMSFSAFQQRENNNQSESVYQNVYQQTIH